MATNIGAIVQLNTSDATATAAQILSGKIAYVKGSKVTGTMANQGAKTSSLNCGGSYTIPAGYHNGSGKITANSLSSQTDATAAAGDIMSGKTAWVKGSKLTGTATKGYTSVSSSSSKITHYNNADMDPRYVKIKSCSMSGNVITTKIEVQGYYAGDIFAFTLTINMG